MIIQRFDAPYLERLRSRDPDTERDFVAYFSQLILIKVRSRVRWPQLIEDIRQETFLRTLAALRSSRGIHTPEAFGAFVNSVCNNVLMEFLRKQGRHLAASLAPSDAPVHDDAPGPEESLITEERKAHVRRILDELSDRDRLVLRAVFVEERDKDEVCAQLSVGRDYLRVLLHRAKTQFREALAANETPAQQSPPTADAGSGVGR